MVICDRVKSKLLELTSAVSPEIIKKGLLSLPRLVGGFFGILRLDLTKLDNSNLI